MVFLVSFSFSCFKGGVLYFGFPSILIEFYIFLHSRNKEFLKLNRKKESYQHMSNNPIFCKIRNSLPILDIMPSIMENCHWELSNKIFSSRTYCYCSIRWDNYLQLSIDTFLEFLLDWKSSCLPPSLSFFPFSNIWKFLSLSIQTQDIQARNFDRNGLMNESTYLVVGLQLHRQFQHY